MTGPNHPLHLILTIITCGFWILPWLFIASSNRRRYQTVDPDGTVRTLRSSQSTTERRLAIGVGVAIALLLVVGQGHVGGVVAFVGVVALFGFAIRYAVQRLSAGDDNQGSM
ncbi:hypothetical protein [Mycolicibacterium hodleri]|uniref:hypothetical protein n=1 Tax=Mycolicibacterium hodleri TaxID=49897 RepID=UPI0021F2B55D|nr:hypothetical protein [Mycolicibacterium hodleri]